MSNVELSAMSTCLKKDGRKRFIPRFTAECQLDLVAVDADCAKYRQQGSQFHLEARRFAIDDVGLRYASCAVWNLGVDQIGQMRLDRTTLLILPIWSGKTQMSSFITKWHWHQRYVKEDILFKMELLLVSWENMVKTVLWEFMLVNVGTGTNWSSHWHLLDVHFFIHKFTKITKVDRHVAGEGSLSLEVLPHSTHQMYANGEVQRMFPQKHFKATCTNLHDMDGVATWPTVNGWHHCLGQSRANLVTPC